MNSKIILCKGIKIDRNYTNVLSYSEDQMLSLCREKAIDSAENYSFIRQNNTIFVDFKYADCLIANYIAFQNPDYSNKWFFAWIDEVRYKSNKNVEINFTIDAWSTWFSYWSVNNCFVIREHTNLDTIGSNTQPENLQIGDYIVNAHLRDEFNTGGMRIVMSSTVSPSEKETVFRRGI